MRTEISGTDGRSNLTAPDHNQSVSERLLELKQAATAHLTGNYSETLRLRMTARAPALPPKPRWDGTTLWLGEKALKRIKNRQQHGLPTNVLRILTAFQESGWQPMIDNPLAGMGLKGTRLADTTKETVASLNDKLLVIRFSMADRGRRVCWSILTLPARSP